MQNNIFLDAIEKAQSILGEIAAPDFKATKASYGKVINDLLGVLDDQTLVKSVKEVRAYFAEQAEIEEKLNNEAVVAQMLGLAKHIQARFKGWVTLTRLLKEMNKGRKQEDRISAEELRSHLATLITLEFMVAKDREGEEILYKVALTKEDQIAHYKSEQKILEQNAKVLEEKIKKLSS